MTGWAEQAVRNEKIAKREAAKARKAMKPKSRQSQRRAITLNWRRERKRQLWNEATASIGPFSCTAYAIPRPNCGLCGRVIWNFEDCELDHKIPVRRGGDCDSNTHLVHALGNRAKGSQTLDKYLAGKSKDELRRLCGV